MSAFHIFVKAKGIVIENHSFLPSLAKMALQIWQHYYF